MAVIEASNAAIEAAAEVLRAGQLVAFPTETVYGLGADATNGRAVAAIFAAKGRPRFNPLIVHVPDMEAAARLGRLGDLGRQLAAAFWPGALSLVVAKRPDCTVADLATAGLDTIALRVPRHPVAQALLRAADGATSLGLESTVVDVTGEEPIVLRLGGVAREALARVLGRSPPIATGDATKPASPGMLERHYAPAARLRLHASDAREGEALLAFGREVPQHAGPMRNLSASGDLVEAAANLFSALRALDAAGAGTIAVMPIPDQGLGEAINDRLRRAARMP
jgi:L-threonylcarbamoyladenylate synthase